ncbi:MAG: hypothetical protein S4CHLAM20_10260 [Chlamydiia bacterium]|nr:hypothetical protein [Chlamydiia bacterium]
MAAASPQIKMLVQESPFQAGDVVMSMDSTDVQILRIENYNVVPITELKDRGVYVPKNEEEAWGFVKEIFSNLPQETKRVFVRSTITDVQRNNEAVEKIKKVTSSSPFALLSNSEDIITPSQENAKLMNKGKKAKDHKKPLEMPLQYLKTFVRGAEELGIEFYLENRDKQNPLKVGSWATAILKYMPDSQKIMFPSIVTEEDSTPLKALVDIDNKSFTINMIEETDGKSEINLINSMPEEKEGKKNKVEKLDLNMKELYEGIQADSKNTTMVALAISSKLEAYNLGKDNENKVGLAFSGDVSDKNEVELLSNINIWLKKFGLNFAECSLISTKDKLEFHAQTIFHTHYRKPEIERSVKFSEKVVYYDAIKDDIEKMLEVLPEKLIGPPAAGNLFSVTRDIKKYSGAEIFGSILKVIVLIAILPITLIALVIREVNRANAKIVVYERASVQIADRESSKVTSEIDKGVEVDVVKIDKKSDVEKEAVNNEKKKKIVKKEGKANK